MLRPCLILFLAAAGPATADTVIASRTIRAQSVISELDVSLIDDDVDGAYASLDDVVGLEARVALFAGRPVRSGEVGPPALVDRNQIVTLFYRAGGLSIVAEGRALGRAGPGERLRVMNLESRQTITGEVREDGTVTVGGTTATLLSN